MAHFPPFSIDDAPPRARLRVLMVGLEWFSDNPGGGGRYLTDLAVGLAERGHRVTVLVPRQHDGLAPAETLDGVSVRRFPVGGTLAKVREAACAARRALATEGPFDVVHSHFALYGLGPLWLPALGRVRRVCQFQGPWAAESAVEGEGRASRAAKYAIERAAYARCDRFVVLSRAFGELLARDYGVRPDRIDVIPAAVDLARFRPPEDRDALRERLGHRGPIVFATRRLVRRMGLDVLLEAFALTRAALPAARLVVAGSGPLAGELAGQADRLGLAGAVDWLGRVSDAALVAHYQAADVTVVPSVALEGFGLITVESLACGTPVIGTAEGGTAEILAPLCSDALVAPSDAGALAARLIDALSGARPLPASSACRAYAEAHYGWEPVLDQLEGALRP